MKLYFAPGACSLSPHIVLREAGAKFDLEQVDLREKKTKKGDDYWRINPKGQVPLLELDDGQMISEGPPDHPRRVQEDFQGDAREQVQEHRQDA